MSALDSGMEFASPFSPLTHSLIGRSMPNSMGMQAGGQPGTIRNTGGGSYMRAHNMARGTPTPQGGMSGGGPMNNSIMTAAMLDAAGVGDDERDKYKKITDPAQLKEVLSLRHQAAAQKQPPAFGQPQQPAQPTIGGPTPEGVAPGSMQILQGQGKNAMSAQDLAAWQQNIQGKLGAGESLNANGLGAGPQQMRQPGTMYRELTGQPGFTVGGMTPPQAAQPQQPDLAATLKGHGIDPAYVQQLTSNGMTLQQAIQTAAGEARQQQTAAHQQQSEQRQDTREQGREQHQQIHEQLMELRHQQQLASQQGNDGEIQRLQSQINTLMKPQPQQAPQGTPDISQLASGQRITINGHVYEKP